MVEKEEETLGASSSDLIDEGGADIPRVGDEESEATPAASAAQKAKAEDKK